MNAVLPTYIWPRGKSCAVFFSVDVDAEAPLLWEHRGMELKGLGRLEQRRYGPRVGLYRILDLLDEFSAKGSFYVPGIVAQNHPEILPLLMERGQECGLHGFYHEPVQDLTDRENRDVLMRSMDLFQAQTGQRPQAYRSPAWEMTPGLIRLLLEKGFAHDSSLMGFDHPYEIGGLCEIPVQWLSDDALFFKFENGPHDRWRPADPVQVAESWIEEFEGLREFGGLFTLTVHPWISGRPQRIRMLRRVLSRIAGYDDVWWATAGELAAWHRDSANAGVFSVPVRNREMQPR